MANKIGRYEIQDEIGRGAFGQVYRAFDPDVNRRVAVKVLNTVGDPEILARFRNEAAAAGNLNHPNIVTIYDFGEEKGVPFIVMELVEGRDLQKTMAARRLSLLEKMEIMEQVAEGLHFAHSNGVVHRDVKPANIMVLPDGAVKILDFGIARLNQSTSARQTRTGYLVGTILYMSPEQFQDGIVDSLCDIWAYGVVYYEMLTGKYPFEAKDNAGLMYKVTRVDPARIRSLAPDCPEALEQIVHRALARDRELRYQTLDDLQLDAGPVLADLRRQQATGLVSQARALFEGGQLDEAQSMVRRILDLDPGSLESRQLRDQISRQMQRRSVRPRVDNLLKDAEREMAERRFGEATESLASAMRLDPGDSSIRVRLDESRRLAEMSARAAELVSQAEREFRLQEFGGAYRLCAEALRLDEEHPQAKRLMEAIQQEIARRDRQRKLDEGLEKARGLLLIQAFEEAFSVLETLEQEFPAEPPVEQLLASARARQEERDKRNRLQEEMQMAKRLLKERRFADAVERLRRMQPDFAGDPQFAELLAFAEEELRRQAKDQEIASLVERATEAAAEKQFDAALQAIDQGLKKYASDSTLIRLFQSTMAAKTAFEKERAIEEAMRRGAELRQQGRHGDALDIIETAVSRYGPEPALLRFRRDLQGERDQLRRAEEVRNALRQGEELLRQKSFAQASALLQAAAAKYPDEPELQALLVRVAEANRAEERRRFIQEQLARAAQLEGAQQWDSALAAVEDALARYPDSAELANACARLQKGFQAAQEAASARLQIKQALAARDWEGAARLLDGARTSLPFAELAELQQQLDAARNRAGLDALVAEVQNKLGSGDLARAKELLDTGLGQYGRQERLLRLQQFWQRETAYRECMASARKALAERRFDAANDFLQKALQSKPADAEALALVDRIAAEHESAERAEQAIYIQEQLARAGNMEAAGRWEAALKAIDEALARYPGSAELAAARARIQKGFESTRQRETVYRESTASARKALAERRFDAAHEASQKALQAKPSDTDALALVNRVAAERESARAEQSTYIQEQLARAGNLEAAGRWDAALAAIDGALARYPDSTELAAARARIQKGLKSDQQRETAYRESMAAAKKALDQHRFDAAGEMVHKALLAKPDDNLALALLDRIDAAREAERRAQRDTAREIDTMDLANRLDEATRMLDRSTFGLPPVETPPAPPPVPMPPRQAPPVRTPLPEGISAETIIFPAGGQKKTIEPPAFQRPQPVEPKPKSRLALPLWIAVGVAGVALPIWLVHGYLARTNNDQGKEEHKKGPDTTAPPVVRETWEHPTGVRGEPYAAAIEASGGAPPISWSIARGALPAGLKLDPASGRIEGTPAKDGPYTFVARVSDRDGRKAERAFTITIKAPIIVPPGAPLTISETWEHPMVVRGTHYSATLKPTGGSPPILWSLARGALPRGLAFDPRAGRIEGTPMADGQYNFTVKASDREGHTAQRAFSITVKPPEERPPITPPPTISGPSELPPATRGERYSATLHAGGGSGTLSWSVSQGSLPRGVALDPTGRIDGIPADEGTAHFTARVTDREGRFAERALAIVVQPSKKPGCVAKPFVLSQYGDSPSGTFTWTGNLAGNSDLTIRGRQSSPYGNVRGEGLPPAGIPVKITIVSGNVKLKDGPAQGNCFMSPLVLHSDAQAVSSITINWAVYQN